MTTDAKAAHWDRIYEKKAAEKLGWYEETPQPSLDLIRRCKLALNDPILDVGTGSSRLIDHLLADGFQSITASDISQSALDTLSARLSPEANSRLRLIADDITRPQHLPRLHNIALWHDRALLHFLTDPADQDTYRDTLLRVLRPGGHAIIAAFALYGADSCSGLPVQRYDAQAMKALLGDPFELVEALDYTYHQPWGDARPYVYTRFQRKQEESLSRPQP